MSFPFPACHHWCVLKLMRWGFGCGVYIHRTYNIYLLARTGNILSPAPPSFSLSVCCSDIISLPQAWKPFPLPHSHTQTNRFHIVTTYERHEDRIAQSYSRYIALHGRFPISFKLRAYCYDYCYRPPSANVRPDRQTPWPAPAASSSSKDARFRFSVLEWVCHDDRPLDRRHHHHHHLPHRTFPRL